MTDDEFVDQAYAMALVYLMNKYAPEVTINIADLSLEMMTSTALNQVEIEVTGDNVLTYRLVHEPMEGDRGVSQA